MSFKKPAELLLKTTLKYYKQAAVFQAALKNN